MSTADFLDATALHVAAVAVAVVGGAFALLGIPVPAPVVVLSAAGVFLIYVVDRAWTRAPEDRANRPARVRWHKRHAWYRWAAAAAAFAAMGWAIPSLPGSAVAAAGALGAAGLVHVVSGAPKRHPLAKPAAIAAGWGIGSVLLPVLLAQPAAAMILAILFVRSAAVAANVLLSDIHDTEGDRAESLPSVAGVRGTAAARGGAQICLLAAAAVALVAFAAWDSPLWGIEASGLIIFGATAHWKNTPHPVVLDLLVGWPAVTWAVFAL